jgi:hypothetical protein
MDCPHCGTWNPDDKLKCWRCDEELPRPKPPKEKRRLFRSMTWVWVLVALMAFALVFQTCSLLQRLP